MSAINPPEAFDRRKGGRMGRLMLRPSRDLWAWREAGAESDAMAGDADAA